MLAAPSAAEGRSMTPRPASHLPASQLPGTQFDPPGMGRVEIRKPTFTELQELDRAWHARRPPNAEHSHWRWATIAGSVTERWIVVDETGGAIAIWCSTAKRLLRLPGGLAYRVDALEVDPSKTSAGHGKLAVEFASLRAWELGADALILAALPQARGFYEAIGAASGPIRGWRCPSDLLPFYLDSAGLRAMVQRAQALRTEPES